MIAFLAARNSILRGTVSFEFLDSTLPSSLLLFVVIVVVVAVVADRPLPARLGHGRVAWTLTRALVSGQNTLQVTGTTPALTEQ